MRTFSVSINIAAPSERVWQVMTDIDRWHEWTPSITSVRRLGAGSFAVGSWALVRQPKFPPALWKITAIEPGRSFTWISGGPGFRAVGIHSVERTTGGSRATLSLDFQGFFGDLFGRMTKGITERYLGFEAKGLKARSENPVFRQDQATR
jgi:uncharacterized protein YndB with AHSA1/START domain